MRPFFAKLQQHYENNPNTWYIAIAVLGFLIYHHNLGFMPQRADEPTRTVVALEMLYTGQYWTPTIQGEWYYRKPPFYNWILVALMKITGSKSDFVMRLPSTVPLFLFAATLFFHAKKYMHHLTAFLAAAAFVTCGRMLIYASLLGHIDVFYSWITYIAFIVLVEYGRKGKWTQALIGSYLIHAIAFLCKGLPSVLFTGLSAIAIILLYKNWKYIFNWRHLLAFGLFCGVVGAYFWKYSQYNDLDGWIDQLWDQSAQRTALDDEKGLDDTLLGLITFPLTNFMHLAPWLLFFPLWFLKGFWQEVKSNTYLKAFGLIFIVNIPVYWLSPGYYPRYLFMLYPMVLVYSLYFAQKHVQSRWMQGFYLLFKVMLPLLVLAPMAAFFVEFQVEMLGLKVLLCVVLAAVPVLGFYYQKKLRLLWLVVALLALRLSFNFFVQEHRMQTGPEEKYMTDAIQAAQLTGDSPLHFYRTGLNHGALWYIEREKGQVIRNTEHPQPGDFFIISEHQRVHWPQDVPFEDRYNFKMKHSEEILFLIKVLESPSEL